MVRPPRASAIAPRGKLVGGAIDMVDLHAGETLFKLRQYLFRIDLRQGCIEINRAALFERRLMQVIERLGAASEAPTKSEQ